MQVTYVTCFYCLLTTPVNIWCSREIPPKCSLLPYLNYQIILNFVTKINCGDAQFHWFCYSLFGKDIIVKFVLSTFGTSYMQAYVQWNLPSDGRIGDSVDIIPHPCNTHLAHMLTRALYQCGDISASSSNTCTNHKSALQVLANQMSELLWTAPLPSTSRHGARARHSQYPWNKASIQSHKPWCALILSSTWPSLDCDL